MWLVRAFREKAKLRTSSYSLNSTTTETTTVSSTSASSVGASLNTSKVSLNQMWSSTSTLGLAKHEEKVQDEKEAPRPVHSVSIDESEDSDDSESETFTQIDLDTAKGSEETDCDEPKFYMFQKLLHEAPFSHVGTKTEKSTSNSNSILPEWTDYQKLEDGRQFITKHFFSIIFAHAIGLILLVTVKPIQSLLLRTSSGIHYKGEKAFTFFLKIFLRLIQWYKNVKYELLTNNCEFREENKNSPSASNILITNEITELTNLISSINEKFRKFIPPLKHELELTPKEQVMYKSLQADLQNYGYKKQANPKSIEPILVTMNPTLPLSQYHLVLIQFTFYGLISKYPHSFGIYEKDRRGIEGFRHIWAVLGYLFGISDEFNCALLKHSSSATNVSIAATAENEAMVKWYEDSILRHILLFSFSMIDETGLHLWRIISAGFTKYFLFMRTDTIIQFILKNLVEKNCLVNNLYDNDNENNKSPSEQVPIIPTTNNFWSNMSLIHRAYYLSYSLIFNFLIKCFLVRIFLNKCTKLMLSYSHYCYRRGKKLSFKHASNNSSFTLRKSICEGSKEELEEVKSF